MPAHRYVIISRSGDMSTGILLAPTLQQTTSASLTANGKELPAEAVYRSIRVILCRYTVASLPDLKGHHPLYLQRSHSSFLFQQFRMRHMCLQGSGDRMMYS